MRKLHKKAFIGDLIMYTVMFFVIVIIFLVFYTGWNAIKPSLDNNKMINTTGGTAAISTVNSIFNYGDTLLIILFVGLIIALIISTILIRVHPVFIGISLIIFIIVVLFSFVIAEAYNKIEESPALHQATVQYSKTSYVMEHYPYFIIPIGAIFLIILMAKAVGNGEGNV